MRGLRKRGAVWWYRITKGGNTYEGSLQTSERRIALERLETIRREITGDRFGERHRIIVRAEHAKSSRERLVPIIDRARGRA